MMSRYALYLQLLLLQVRDLHSDIASKLFTFTVTCQDTCGQD